MVPVTSHGALHFSRLPAFFVMMHWTERSKEQGMKSMSCAAIGGEGKFVMHLRAAGELGGRMYLSSRATAMSWRRVVEGRADGVRDLVFAWSVCRHSPPTPPR